MIFELGQTVKIKGTSRKGEIKSYKFETYKLNNKPLESKKYYLYLGGNQFNWYYEYEIESIDEEFDPKFEIGLVKLLIDINLSSRNYEMVKLLTEQKTKLERGEKK